ncbi:MAG: dTDP-glucose 4,6-dehydratase [Deltaproteobacteria bacterium]|nr:dTDP-glucose 4,6-dehydratase [Deltaproteobacteria bacterium]
MSKAILVTGGLGFIGSNFIEQLIQKQTDISIVNLDKMTYASNITNSHHFKNNSRYTMVRGDICDPRTLAWIFEKHNIQHVIHFAAESHVDNSITGPEAFIQTNCVGTFMLLEQARQSWLTKTEHDLKSVSDNLFLHVSTDEVFGQLTMEQDAFSEETAYDPSSPYSASKASSDLIVKSYFRTYGLKTIVTNCSNNYGPHQHKEKLIPTIIRSALKGHRIPIYGDGTNIRDWIFVKDHCNALIKIMKEGIPGERYNIGGSCEKSNMDIAKQICAILDEITPKKDQTSYRTQIEFVKDRPGHDFRYAVNTAKIKQTIGWVPETAFSDGLKSTIEWYLNHPEYLYESSP